MIAPDISVKAIRLCSNNKQLLSMHTAEMQNFYVRKKNCKRKQIDFFVCFCRIFCSSCSGAKNNNLQSNEWLMFVYSGLFIVYDLVINRPKLESYRTFFCFSLTVSWVSSCLFVIRTCCTYTYTNTIHKWFINIYLFTRSQADCMETATSVA